jgi:hypothetical protein
MSEARNFFLLIGVFIAAPIIAGLGIAAVRNRPQKPAEPVNEGKELETKWTRGLSTKDGTVWRYERCYADGRPYSTQFVIGNSNHTKFDSDSAYPRGHASINGEKARVYATNEQAENSLLEKGNRPSPPMPPPTSPPPAPGWPGTGTNPFEQGSKVGGGFGSKDSKPRFNF